MIVRNEATVITQALDSVRSWIDYCVIVDTGSTDDTIPIIESYFRENHIAGEIHESHWKNFGENRTEALDLCRGKADYIWVMDADDLLVGDPDLSNLTLDSYLLRFGLDFTYWRKQLFRGGLRWAYRGAVHEYPVCLEPSSTEGRIEGDYYVESRRLGHRNLAPDKYQRDAGILQQAMEDDPDDPRSVFYLAQSYFDAGSIDQALHYYTLRSKMGGWDEEIYYSLFRRAVCLERLAESWPASQEAYLAAWRARPHRAEALHEIARHHRLEGRCDLGYVFAKTASQIPFPEGDRLFVSSDIYAWRIPDELSICAFYLNRYRESFDVCVQLLDNRRVPDSDRERILRNGTFCIPFIQDETVAYPAFTVQKLQKRAPSAIARETVTLTITSCKRLELFEKTVNSFLNCCEDLDRIGRWICIDDGSNAADRKRMTKLYPFFEFVWKAPGDKGHAASMNMILDLVKTPWLLHLEDDWHFIVRGSYVTRSIAILRDDPQLGQVLFNRNYAENGDGWNIVGGPVRFTKQESIRYRLHEHLRPGTADYTQHLHSLPSGSLTTAYWPHYSLRPSVISMAALKAIGKYNSTAEHFELEFAERYRDRGLLSAFFDSINCLHLGKLTSETGPSARPNAYSLNNERQFTAPSLRQHRIKLLPDWTSSRELCNLWERQSKGGGLWDDIIVTADDRDIDYYAIINHPGGSDYDPGRSIVFQMEPASGVAQWGPWANPDRREFVQVRSHDRYRNAGEWHLDKTWAELVQNPIKKSRVLSTVTSSRVADPGQQRRVGFLHYIEKRGVGIDIYGRDNAAGFAGYRGSLPFANKNEGVLPYRYTFAAENHEEHNYVTEKFFDALLGECLCLYWGCPNLEEHFDPGTFIRLPLDDFELSLQIVQKAIASDEWSRRIEIIRREKLRFLNEGQFFPVLAQAIHGHVFFENLAVHVINLERRPDRWKSFREASAAAAGAFAARCQRFPAIDGRHVSLTPEVRHLFRYNDFLFRRGMVGCALTHLSLWRQVAYGTGEASIVFEDDARLSQDFNGQMVEVCGQLGRSHADFDIVLLGYFPWTEEQRRELQSETHSVRLRPMEWQKYVGGTFGYIVSQAGARRLLALAERDGVQNGIDWFLMRKRDELKVLQAVPHLVFAPLAFPGSGGDSDIAHDLASVQSEDR